MVDVVAKLGLTVDSRGLAKGTKDLDKFGNQANKTERQTTRATERMSSALRGFASAAGAAFAVSKVIKYSDAYKQLNGRLQIVTSSAEELLKVQRGLENVSRDTRSSLESNAQLYTRLALANESLNRSQSDLIKFTKLVSQGLVISGATASEASSATLQLSQALASGELRGEEFRSVMENGSRIALALAKSLGVTTGELRAMAHDGQLTSDVVFEALIQQADTLNSEFEKMPVTVSQATQVLSDSFLKLIGGSNNLTTATDNIARVILALADNLKAVAEVAIVAATALSARYAVATGIAIARTLTLTGAIHGATAAMRGLAGATGIGAVIYAYQFLIDKTGSLQGILNSLTATVLTAWTAMKKLFSSAERSAQLGAELEENLLSLGEATRAATADNFTFSEALEDVTTQTKAETKATEQSSSALKAYNKLKSKAQAIIEETLTPQEKYAENISEIDDLLKKGLLTQEQYNRATKMYGEQLDSTKEKLRKTAEKAKDSFNEIDRVAERTFDNFANLINDALSGNLRTWADWGNAVKSIITNSISNSIASAGAGSSGGGFSTQSLMSGGNSIMGAISGGLSKQMFSNSSMIGGGINKIGSIFGFGAPKAGMIGPTAGLASKFTVGSGLAGMAGGIGANLLGLGGGIGGDIGGTLGGIAGTLIGGPLGAALGSFAGTALGGLFGNKKPSSKLQSGTVDLATGGVRAREGLTGEKFSQGNQDMVDSLAAVSSQLAAAMGVADLKLGVAASDRYGMEFAIGGGASEFLAPSEKRQAFDTANEFASALTKELSKRAENMPAEVAAAVEAADFGQTQESLEKALSEITGAAAKIALEKAREEAQKAFAAEQKSALEVRLLQVQGNTARLRQMELDTLEPSNRALQERIWHIQDEAEEAQKAIAIAAEKDSLERQLLRLQGHTVELRNRELMDLAPANRALQQRIWALQDEKAALDDLNENDFATLFDFRAAQARARFGANDGGMISGGADMNNLQGGPVVSQQQAIGGSVGGGGEITSDMVQLLQAIKKNTNGSFKLLDRWDGDGLPAERTV